MYDHGTNPLRFFGEYRGSNRIDSIGIGCLSPRAAFNGPRALPGIDIILRGSCDRNAGLLSASNRSNSFDRANNVAHGGPVNPEVLIRHGGRSR